MASNYFGPSTGRPILITLEGQLWELEILPTDEHSLRLDADPAARHPHRPDRIGVRRGGRRRRALHHHLQPVQLDQPGTDPAIP